MVFNFGTLLFWATTKAAILPNDRMLRMLVGAASGVGFLYLGFRYLDFVDTQVGNMMSEE